MDKLQIYFNSEDYSFSQSIINQFKSPNHSNTKPPHSNQREENQVGAAGASGYFQAMKALSTWIEAEASQAGRTPNTTTSQELPHSCPTVAMAAVIPPKTVPTLHGEIKQQIGIHLSWLKHQTNDQVQLECPRKISVHWAISCIPTSISNLHTAPPTTGSSSPPGHSCLLFHVLQSPQWT